MRVQDYWRLANSKSGNPNFMLLTDEGNAYRTASDSESGYQIQNLKDGDEISLTFDTKGRITRIEKVTR